MKKSIFSFLLSFVAFFGLQAEEDFFFFSPAMRETHLKAYSEKEREAIEKDLAVVRSVCMSGAATGNLPVYIASAGAPGARKTTVLERFIAAHPEFSGGAYLDPDPRTLKFMVHTYYQSLSPLNISHSESYLELLKNAYNQWRGGSNYIVLTLLEEAFKNRQTVIHGTTSTGDHLPAFYTQLKAKGYKIVLLLCSCEDSLRKESIAYRNEVIRFYQSSPEEAILKAKLFPQKMTPLFRFGDTLYLYWSDSLFSPERLAATLDQGRMVCNDPEALEKFIRKYEADRAELSQMGKELPSFEELVQIYTARGIYTAKS